MEKLFNYFQKKSARITAKYIASGFAVFMTLQPLVLKADYWSDAYEFSYGKQRIENITKFLMVIEPSSRLKLKDLEYRFEKPGLIANDFEYALVERGTNHFTFAERLSKQELSDRTASWHKVFSLVARSAVKHIPGAVLLRSDERFTGGTTFISHNNNLYHCYVNLRMGTELIPKLGMGNPIVEHRTAKVAYIKVSRRSTPLYGVQVCNNRITRFTKEIPTLKEVASASSRQIRKLIDMNKRSVTWMIRGTSQNIHETLGAEDYKVALETRVNMNLSEIGNLMSRADFDDLKSRIKVNSIHILSWR